MQISAQDFVNQYYIAPTATVYTPWMFAWTSQKLVTPAIVTQTGGTYE